MSRSNDKGEYLLYSNHSPGTKCSKGGKIYLIANLPTGEVLLYSICSLGEDLLYSKYSGRRLAIFKERFKLSLRKFYGRYGDLIKQYEVSLSQILNDILWTDHIQWQPPTDQTLYRTRPFTEFWEVSIEHLRRVWHADRGRWLLQTPGPVPLGLAYVLLVETNPFPNLSLFFRTMLFEYPSVLSRFYYIVKLSGGSFAKGKVYYIPPAKKTKTFLSDGTCLLGPFHTGFWVYDGKVRDI